ncbi:hypothetical protein ACIBHY_54600 [Nonomuraea sp. NPDC050547]|uniref:hypothetical protein n=1 Tax=Nonomuraea sp. NPDC050547 TaxID=3364368 RepID=UPI003790B957
MDEYGEGFCGRPLGEVAETLNRLLVDAYLSAHDRLDVEQGLAALLVIRQLREDLQEGEGYVIESLRAQGVTWAQLAPALEVRSRQSAERRYLSLCGDPSGHAGTTRDRVAATRDHRAAQRAGQAFIAGHADRLREVGRRLADLGDLQQRADAAAAAIHRAVDGRLHRYSELPSRVDWPGRLRQALTADDLPAVLECLRRARASARWTTARTRSCRPR